MFNNKTNGITHRRWLMGANPELADLIDKTIGSRIWHRHPEQLDLFNEYVDNPKVLRELAQIKKRPRINEVFFFGDYKKYVLRKV